MESLRDYLLEHSVYPDEEFNRAEEAAIKALVVPHQNNIFDYYKGLFTKTQQDYFIGLQVILILDIKKNFFLNHADLLTQKSMMPQLLRSGIL